jgi:hypothetical protein
MKGEKCGAKGGRFGGIGEKCGAEGEKCGIILPSYPQIYKCACPKKLYPLGHSSLVNGVTPYR